MHYVLHWLSFLMVSMSLTGLAFVKTLGILDGCYYSTMVLCFPVLRSPGELSSLDFLGQLGSIKKQKHMACRPRIWNANFFHEVSVLNPCQCAHFSSLTFCQGCLSSSSLPTLAPSLYFLRVLYKHYTPSSLVVGTHNSSVQSQHHFTIHTPVFNPCVPETESSLLFLTKLSNSLKSLKIFSSIAKCV